MNDAGSALHFDAGGRRLSLSAAQVREVRRPTRITHVPNAPAALLGVANMRGIATPVVSLARALNLQPGRENRLILIERHPQVAIAVDRVDRLDQVAKSEALDLDRMLEQVTGRSMTQSIQRGSRVRSAHAGRPIQHEALLPFSIGDQSFALPLSDIVEIMKRPATVALFPHADPAIHGSIGWRDGVLPIASLARLLALPEGPADRLVVTRIGGCAIGLAVDAVQTVMRVPESQIDPIPVALARGTAEARIQSIVRLDGGRRLISLLSPQTLLRDDLVAAMEKDGTADDIAIAEDRVSGEPHLIFEIGGECFGFPLDHVREVAMPPTALTPIPKAPAFLRGIFNLRGTPLPIIDLGERLGIARSGSGRTIILTIGDVTAGLMVDRIRGIETAPTQPSSISSDDPRAIDTVIVSTEAGPVTLIVDPARLLDAVERDVLTAYGRSDPSAR